MKSMLKRIASVILLAAFACAILPAATVEAAAVGRPKILAVSIEGARALQVQWRKVPGATGYQVFRSDSEAGRYTRVDTVKTNVYTDKKVRNGKVYFYKVRAVKKGSLGGHSAPVEVKMDAARPSLTAKASSDVDVVLRWNAVKDAGQYQVYMSTRKRNGFQKAGLTSVSSYSKTFLTTGQTYHFMVRGCTRQNGVHYYGRPSAVKSATPRKVKPESNAKTIGRAITLVNQYRKAEGLHPLKTDAVLAKMAQQRAKEASQRFSHTRPNGSDCDTIAKEFRYTRELWLENLAQSYWRAMSAENLMLWWKGSANHWSTVMDPTVEYVGVGVHKAKNGNWYYALLTAKDK